MSKKDDKITALENHKTASTVLLRTIGQALGITLGGDAITIGNIPGVSMTFIRHIEALWANGARTNGDPRTRDATTIGLAGGNLQPNNFADMDEETDRANAKLNPAAVERAGSALQSSTLARQSDETQLIVKDESEAQLTVDRCFDVIADIHRELGIVIGPDQSIADAAKNIHTELLRIKNPSGDVAADAAGTLSKGDTLGEAISHNRAAQRNLELELGKARAIIQRVAGAMQISQWDADGTELVERAQRWDGFKHALRKSLDVWRARAEVSRQSDFPDGSAAIVLELSGFLALLTSHKELAAWLKNKPKVASGVVLSLASEGPTQGRQFTSKDLASLALIVGNGVGMTDGSVWLTSISDSSVANAEFVNLMNLVILPILARQGA
jgi:hypothetical protein